jgi:hypothetical protein
MNELRLGWVELGFEETKEYEETLSDRLGKIYIHYIGGGVNSE